MDKQDKKRIARVAEEAARLLRENPEFTYKQAIDKAREIYEGAKKYANYNRC